MESITSFTLSAADDTAAFTDIGASVNAVLGLWKTVNGLVEEIVFRSPEQFIGIQWISTSTGQPNYWTVQGGTIVQFDRTADVNYTIYARVRSKLDIATDYATNWLALNAEDAYVFAALVQAEPFLKNDKRVGTWRAMLETVISQLEEADTKVRAMRQTALVPDAFGYVGLSRPFNINSG
jgi:hypothetical protein